MIAGKTYDERQAMAATQQRTPLARETIVEAGLRVARAEGMAALSMRRLARELGVSPMASYRHIVGREELGALVLDRIFATRRPVIHPNLSWTITDAVMVLAQYPGAAPLLTTDAAQQPAVRAWLLSVGECLPHERRSGRLRALLTLVAAAADRPADRELRHAVREVAADWSLSTTEHVVAVGVSDAA